MNMTVTISELWTTQRRFDRSHKIPHLIELHQNGEMWYDPILIREAPDGEYEIVNGHHRVMAVYLAGEEYLPYRSYILIQSDSSAPRFGRIAQRVFEIEELHELLEFKGQDETEISHRPACVA